MIEPTNADVGREVYYPRTAERGVISSVTRHFVFVRYGSDTWSKATLPQDLEWVCQFNDDEE